jgi:hypothetical protein
MHLFATTDAEQVLELGKLAAVIEKGEPRKELATQEPRKDLATKAGKDLATKERKGRKGNGSPLITPGPER